MKATFHYQREINTSSDNVGNAPPTVNSYPEYKMIGQLWATIHANLPDGHKPPKVQSTPKEFWVIPYPPCRLDYARAEIQLFITKELTQFKGKFIISAVWIPLREYTYDVNSKSLTPNGDGPGILVITTKFPFDFHKTEKEDLFKTVQSIAGEAPFAKHCPVATEIIKLRRNRIGAIGKEMYFDKQKPSIESPAFARILSFPVDTGITNARNAASLYPKFIKAEFSGIIDKIRGFAFLRIMERDVGTNEIKSLTLMAVIIDEVIFGLKLSDVLLNAWAIEAVVDYGKYVTHFGKLPDNYREPFRETFKIWNAESEDAATQESKEFKAASIQVYQFLIDNVQGSVAVAINVHASVYQWLGRWRKDWNFSIAVIFTPNGSKGSHTYFDRKIELPKMLAALKNTQTKIPASDKIRQYKVGDLTESASNSEKLEEIQNRFEKYFDLNVLEKKYMEAAKEHLEAKLWSLKKENANNTESINVVTNRLLITNPRSDTVFILYESNTILLNGPTIGDVLENIKTAFENNTKNKDEYTFSRLKLRGKYNESQINLIKQVYIKGYYIRAGEIPDLPGHFKVFLVLSIPIIPDF